MSKLTEYLNLIPKGLKNPMKILDGIYNEIKLENNLLQEDEVDEILRRRLICQSCPFFSLNAQSSEEYYDIFKEHYQTDRTDSHCSVCGCNEKLKTSSLDSNCGLDTDEKTKHLELKWNKYKQ